MQITTYFDDLILPGKEDKFFSLDTKTYVGGLGVGEEGGGDVGKKRPKRLRVYEVVNTYCNSPKHCGKTFRIQKLYTFTYVPCTK